MQGWRGPPWEGTEAPRRCSHAARAWSGMGRKGLRGPGGQSRAGQPLPGVRTDQQAVTAASRPRDREKAPARAPGRPVLPSTQASWTLCLSQKGRAVQVAMEGGDNRRLSLVLHSSDSA